MADITIIGGDYEATRKFLLGAVKIEPGVYMLMKDTEFIDEGERIMYSCDIYAVNAVIAASKQAGYVPSFTIIGAPDGSSKLGGLANVIREVEKPSGGSIEIKLGRPTSGRGSATIQVIFDPTGGNTLDNKTAFEYHLDEFRDYMARSIAEAVDSDTRWNVPRREFCFESGALRLAIPLRK